MFCLLFDSLTPSSATRQSLESVPRLTSDNFTCCHTETKLGNHDFCHNRSHHTDTHPDQKSRALSTELPSSLVLILCFVYNLAKTTVGYILNLVDTTFVSQCFLFFLSLVCLFVWSVGFLTSSPTTMLYRGQGPKTERLRIIRAATHKTELGDHDFCLSQSHGLSKLFR